MVMTREKLQCCQPCVRQTSYTWQLIICLSLTRPNSRGCCLRATAGDQVVMDHPTAFYMRTRSIISSLSNHDSQFCQVVELELRSISTAKERLAWRVLSKRPVCRLCWPVFGPLTHRRQPN